MKKYVWGFAMIFLASFSSYAQNYPHYTLWSRVSIQKKISKYFDVNADFLYRRQNDFSKGNYNLFDSRYVEAYRISTVYRKGNWAVSLAPIVFNTFPLYGKVDDLKRPVRLEIRPVAYLEWTKVLSPKWTFRSRFGYEYRLFKRSDNTFGDEQARIRLRIQWRYNLNKNNIVYVSEEPLLNIPPNLPDNNFSQNQLTLMFSHAFSPHFTTEIGYMWNHRQRASLVEFDEENTLHTHFIIRL